MLFRGRGAYACHGPVKRRTVTETTADCERITYEKHRITIYHRGGSWAPTVWTTAITQAMMRTYQKEPFAVSIGISVSLSRYLGCTFKCVYYARATSSPHKQTYTRTRTQTQAQTQTHTDTHKHTHSMPAHLCTSRAKIGGNSHCVHLANLWRLTR